MGVNKKFKRYSVRASHRLDVVVLQVRLIRHFEGAWPSELAGDLARLDKHCELLDKALVKMLENSTSDE
jgi:hypothetical protein